MEETRQAGALDASEHACVACGVAREGDEARCHHCGAAQRVASYVVERLVHQGPRGRLYLARSASGQRVALKEIAFATVPDAAHLDAFQRECDVLRQLKHPAVPAFIEQLRVGAGVHTRLYLVQEFVEGESLLARLQHHRFDEAEVRAILRDVLTTLSYLHGLSPRLLHRDLKPANLIRRPDGSIALVDFGSSRDLAGAQTHGSTLVGTIGYMPPEQLGGTVSPSSDLYALGASMVHLLSRKEPSQLLDRGLELAIDDAIHASAELKQLLKRMAARESPLRFQSAEEALRVLEQGESVVGKLEKTPAQSVDVAWLDLEGAIGQSVRRAAWVGWLLGVAIAAGGSWLVIARAGRHDSPPLLATALLCLVPGFLARDIAREVAIWRWLNRLQHWVQQTLPRQPQAQDELVSRASTYLSQLRLPRRRRRS